MTLFGAWDSPVQREDWEALRSDVHEVQIGGQAVADDESCLSPPVEGRGSDPEKNVRPKIATKKRTYTWICQWCNMPFDTEIYSKRYCNDTHKKYAQRQRKHEREAQLEL